MTARIKDRGAHVRRLILLGLAILVAALASTAGAPATADAIMVDSRVPSNHVGWVYTRAQLPCGFIAPCAGPYHTAWRWSGSSWSQSRVGTSTRVYAYPYSGAWHWIWTQQTGWLAIETSKLDRHGYACSYWCA